MINPLTGSAELASLPSRLTKQRDLLLSYLRDHHHIDIELLAQVPTTLLIHDCFEQFVIFLADVAPVADWYRDFIGYINDLMSYLLRPAGHVLLVTRSSEFAEYVGSLGL